MAAVPLHLLLKLDCSHNYVECPYPAIKSSSKTILFRVVHMTGERENIHLIESQLVFK
jgi:hypothetical protein